MTTITIDQVKEIPKEYRRLLRDLERLEYLREASTSVPAFPTDGIKVQTSVMNRSMVISDELIDLERDIDQRVREMHEKEEAAKELFRDVREPDRKVLIYHYVRHLPITEIAKIIFYTPRWCYYLRRRGLKEAERKSDDNRQSKNQM